MCRLVGCEVVVVEPADADPRKSLADDVLAILTVFGARCNGLATRLPATQMKTPALDRPKNPPAPASRSANRHQRVGPAVRAGVELAAHERARQHRCPADRGHLWDESNGGSVDPVDRLKQVCHQPGRQPRQQGRSAGLHHPAIPDQRRDIGIGHAVFAREWLGEILERLRRFRLYSPSVLR